MNKCHADRSRYECDSYKESEYNEKVSVAMEDWNVEDIRRVNQRGRSIFREVAV
jgi:hypothetical protein